MVSDCPRGEFIRASFEARLSSTVSRYIFSFVVSEGKGLFSAVLKVSKRALFTTAAASKNSVVLVALNPEKGPPRCYCDLYVLIGHSRVLENVNNEMTYS